MLAGSMLVQRGRGASQSQGPTAQVVEGVEVVKVIEGTSLRLLDHLDHLDTLDYFCLKTKDHLKLEMALSRYRVWSDESEWSVSLPHTRR